MTSEPVIGIDLGTTHSLVAWLDAAGRPEVIVNAEGDRLTASAVLIEGDAVVVGAEALKALAAEADRVAVCAKRDMGSAAYHRQINGRHYPPEVLAACILDKLRRDATVRIGSVGAAVITVPAYFDEVRRKATQDAGYMAGLDVLDIINEPTAAAVACAYQKGLLTEDATAERPARMLVYDLGGGTFDVTIMEIRGHEFVTLATDGDVQLGGYDWDQRLVDLAADEFGGRHNVDPREDPTAAGQLWRECEQAKRTLSARNKTSLLCNHAGHMERIELSRERFEEATHDLVDRTRFTVGQALSAAGLAWDQIDHLLLVGGATRMPMVRRMLEQASGKRPDTSMAADEAVACGAALHAARLVGRDVARLGQFAIRNVNSHSLGVVGLDPATGQRRNAAVIPRNTPLPVTARRVFRTRKQGQKSILVEVVEGESPSADACTPIGRCTVAPLPPDLPAGSPVEVRFHYRQDGRLRVRVTLPGTSTATDAVFARASGLPQEELDRWQAFVTGRGEP